MTRRDSTPKRRLPAPPTPRRPPDRPTLALGRQVKNMRTAAKLTTRTLADMAGMRQPQVSLLETGHNVEARQYTLIARALGFRDALELFRASDADPLRRHLDRGWALLDTAQKKRVLALLNRLLLGE